MSEVVDVEVHLVLAITAEAVLVTQGDGIDDEQTWIPLSQIEDTDEELEEGTGNTLYMPIWLAEEKGLV